MRRATESDPVTLDELRQMAAGRFGDMVKGVVDLQCGVDDPLKRAAIAEVVGRAVRR
jgi:hypothetical protein